MPWSHCQLLVWFFFEIMFLKALQEDQNEDMTIPKAKFSKWWFRKATQDLCFQNYCDNQPPTTRLQLPNTRLQKCRKVCQDWSYLITMTTNAHEKIIWFDISVDEVLCVYIFNPADHLKMKKTTVKWLIKIVKVWHCGKQLHLNDVHSSIQLSTVWQISSLLLQTVFWLQEQRERI